MRATLYALSGLFFAGYAAYLHLAGYRVPWGYRLFFLGTISFFVSLMRLERRDLATLRQEDELCRQDPKHLFRADTGLANSSDLRLLVAGSLVTMGLGMLILTFERAGKFPVVFHIGLLFWGSALCICGILLHSYAR